MKKELGKSDIYAIYFLADEGKDKKVISKELNIGVKLVGDVLSKRPEIKNKSIPTTSAKVTTSKDMMIRQTSGKGTNSVAIMTKEASQVNDSFKKNLDPTIVSRTSRNAIYRPNK